jgi:hypothetical protein
MPIARVESNGRMMKVPRVQGGMGSLVMRSATSLIGALGQILSTFATGVCLAFVVLGWVCRLLPKSPGAQDLAGWSRWPRG